MDDLKSKTINELRSLAKKLGVRTKDDDGKSLPKSVLRRRIASSMPEQPSVEEEPVAPAQPEESEETPVEPVFVAPKPVPARIPRVEKAPKPAQAADTGFFRVTCDAHFAMEGIVYKLAEGSIVSKQTHDLKMLEAQGVEMEPSGPPSLERDGFGDPIYPGRVEPGIPDHVIRARRKENASGELVQIVDGKRVPIPRSIEDPSHPEHVALKSVWGKVI